ncbi:uncharacterized protein PRCAT00003815001 [Priceomyces carsonii]|uniref:uncharacterized protein n=1 Tax=Priceomyces carsonii TaxID=28549 RepID=UPI002ED8D61C|nr:unnamed protein product [Priceomyces carsonii]
MSVKKVAVPKEIEVTLGKGVSGTIAVPHSAELDNPFEGGHAPSTTKAVLLLHGQGGHRNYCYQKHLAHRLASEHGIYSLRIDFRGCGNSGENEDPQKGRTLDQDIEDIQDCAEFLTCGEKNPLKINFTLSAIISHSRGSVAMFLWALKQDLLLKSKNSSGAIGVPSLVNTSCRYRSETVADRYPINDDSFEFLTATSLRHGKLQAVDIPKPELQSLALPDLSKLEQLSADTSVLSIYGLNDLIIPIEDSALIANVLNRGKSSHELRLIPNADHNFYGVHQINNELDAEEYNPKKLPLNSKKLVNYNYVVADIIVKYLAPERELERFLYQSETIGRLTRWKNIDGIANFRDVGGWKITSPRFKENTISYVKPNMIFRCASVSNVTPLGLLQLKDLGIAAVFDLRATNECEKYGVPKDFEKYGIKRIHAPVFREDLYSPEEIAVRYANLMTSWFTYVQVYEVILEFGTDCFRTVFEYIRDENKPFLFHCTAGKDRTGVLAMLILLLLGVDKHTIGKEYELTTVGLKPNHADMKDEFMKTLEKIKGNAKSTEIEQMISQGREGWSLEKDGFENLISSRYEAMLAAIELFNDKYGGIINYMKEQLHFSIEDIKKINSNLVIVDNSGYFRDNFDAVWHHRAKI